MDPENSLSQKKIILNSKNKAWTEFKRVKHTVSIKRTVCKKVHISLLNVLYDPKIGTIIS